MNEYKPKEPIFYLAQKRKLLKCEDIEPSSLQKQNYLFDTNFKELAQNLLNKSDDKTAISEMISFLSTFKKLFYSTNNIIIPVIIENNIFKIILDQIPDMYSLIFPLFKEMVHCKTENLYLLLQHNFCHVLIKSMLDYDDDVCQCSIECLIEIISRDRFFYVLVFSTNIISIFYDFLNDIDIQAYRNKVIYIFVFLSEFFEHGPMPDENICSDPSNLPLLDQYHNFIRNCENPEFFIEQIFKDFLINGIIISHKNSPFYQLLELILSKSSNSNNVNLVNNYLYIIFKIIMKNVLTVDILLFRFPFYDYFENWVNDGIANIVTYTLIAKITYLLFASEIPIEKNFITHSVKMIKFIFVNFLIKSDYPECESEDAEEEEEESKEQGNEYSQEEKQDLECGTILALVQLVLNRQSQDDIIHKLFKRKDKIIDQFLNGPYYSTRKYAYLILSIAANSNYYIEFLTPDVLERLFLLMEEKRKNFVDFALDSLNLIFRREKNNQRNGFINIFYKCQGVDFLYNLLDSTNNDENYDEEIHSKTGKILDDYFSNKDDD